MGGKPHEGIAIIYGKYLWYDGLAGVKMKWVKADTPFEKGYNVQSLWYKRIDNDELSSEEEPDSAMVLTSMNKSPTVMQQATAVQKRSLSDSQKSTLEPMPPKKVRKKHVMGISIAQVSNKGKKPQCQYCRIEINRKEWHTVKTTSGKELPWKNVAHYHFKCYHYLNKTEQQQLLTLIRNGDYMDSDDLEELEQIMNTYG